MADDKKYIGQFTGSQIDEAIGKALRGTLMNAETYDPQGKSQDIFAYVDNGLVGKAPAGYGLGENAVYAPDYDWNKIYGSGYYMGHTNAPDGAWWIGQHIESSEGVIQFARRNTPAVYCMRSKVNGEWQPWEYVNPPLELGVEYRTTERYLGKPVYAKAVSCGALVNGTKKTVSHGIGSYDAIVSVYGYAYNPNSTDRLSLPFVNGNLSSAVFLGVTDGSVVISCIADWSSWPQSTVVIKYTKTTD